MPYATLKRYLTKEMKIKIKKQKNKKTKHNNKRITKSIDTKSLCFMYILTRHEKKRKLLTLYIIQHNCRIYYVAKSAIILIIPHSCRIYYVAKSAIILIIVFKSSKNVV